MILIGLLDSPQQFGTVHSLKAQRAMPPHWTKVAGVSDHEKLKPFESPFVGAKSPILVANHTWNVEHIVEQTRFQGKVHWLPT
jgi:hypothetical protein